MIQQNITIFLGADYTIFGKQQWSYSTRFNYEIL